MNLSIVSAKYVAPLKVELHFNDDTIKTIDVGAFIRNHPHPQYNSYLNENKFKKFKIEFGNIVWGKNWDLIFPIDKLPRSAQKRQGDAFALSLDELDDCAPALSSPDDEATAAELGRSISAFLRTQSEEVRSMFILRYFYCEPVEALAARFHCGESRIKTTLLRTRRKLKEHLIKEGYCEA